MSLQYEDESVRLPDQINLQAVTSWLSRCEKYHHDSQCSTRRYARTAAPGSGGIYLLDVSRGSVALASLTDRFIALSYVWGSDGQLKLLKSNRVELSKAGALQSETFRPRIGRTLRDAITVVRALGERYLWIDALCICQDDEDHMSAQIKQMAAIYDAAMLTIVACTAESYDSPLPGVERGTRLPCAVPVAMVDSRWGGSIPRSAAGGSGLLWNLPQTQHSKRAWTFQEVMLSRRCLFFFGNQVFFQCQQSRCEEGNSAEDVSRPRNLAGNWPPLREIWVPKSSRYSEIVHDYTPRQLSYPKDRLDAFSALISALETEWNWSFRYALPLQVFSRALLWVPRDPNAYLTSSRETLQLPTDHHFPSWSWLSYPGLCEYFVKNSPDISGGLLSFIDWPDTFSWDGERLQRLGDADGHQIDASLDFQPNSLSAALIDELRKGFPEGGLLNGLQEDGLPYELGRRLPPGTLLISAKTASLKGLGEASISPKTEAFKWKLERLGNSGHVCTALVSEKGEWCGTLVGISESRLRELLKEEDPELLKLVVLSTSASTWVRWDRTAPIPCFNDSEYNNEQWCTWNVVLIAKQSGEPAYRRLAIGEIHKGEWDKLNPRCEVVHLA